MLCLRRVAFFLLSFVGLFNLNLLADSKNFTESGNLDYTDIGSFKDFTHRIIGDNDLVKVEGTLAQNPKLKAIGRMALGCTVTHVGNGIAITAGHCFTSGIIEDKKENLACSPGEHDVRWGVNYDDEEGYMTSHCTQILAIEKNRKKDYAIFRISPVPDYKMEVAKNHTLAVDDEISIFSHPRRRPLEWSNWCKVEGFLERSAKNQFFYSCDTEGGSSGAAVLDKNNEIVGIHNFYNGPLNRNGATLMASTPLSAILEKETNASEFDSLNSLSSFNELKFTEFAQ